MPAPITGIGSLPYTEVERAVGYSLLHTIPFLPEMPGEKMIEYIKHPGNLRSLKSFSEYRFEKVKVQCVGPTTLRKLGYEKQDGVRRVCEHLETVVKPLASDELIIFLDEPGGSDQGSLENVFKSQRLEKAGKKFKKVERGIHNCGPNFSQLFDLDIEIVSFDASTYRMGNEARKGKKIAWGVKERAHVTDYREGDLLSAPCGMAKYEIEECEEMLMKLVDASEKIV